MEGLEESITQTLAFVHALFQQDGQILNPHASFGRRLCIFTRQRWLSLIDEGLYMRV